MRHEKVTEFITVLIFAMGVGALAMGSILYLNGMRLTYALLALVVVTISSWRYLRRRFGRNG